METLFKSEVENAIETVKTLRSGNATYYIDKLKSGEYGVSKDERPLVKFKSIDQAELYLKAIPK